jgi:hypothetical protein
MHAGIHALGPTHMQAQCRGEFTSGRKSDIFARNTARCWEDAPQCGKLLTGSKSSACPSTRNASPRTISILRSSATSPIKTSKKIGVASLGHRRKLLRAIADLKDVKKSESGIAKPSLDAAERRQVTVMFCDMVGSTALSARMDPEDVREVISAYQKCVADTVNRFGGFVAKYMGDGVLVYFGYPQAHEDDAERAVRAGLKLIAAVSALKAASPLQTRVGIATGMLVVGDLVGSGEARHCGRYAEPCHGCKSLPNRTRSSSPRARKLLGNLFELRDLGFREVKGIAGPALTRRRCGQAQLRAASRRSTKSTLPL